MKFITEWYRIIYGGHRFHGACQAANRGIPLIYVDEKAREPYDGSPGRITIGKVPADYAEELKKWQGEDNNLLELIGPNDVRTPLLSGAESGVI